MDSRRAGCKLAIVSASECVQGQLLRWRATLQRL